MDELVHHCLRELSFDGDLGCDVSRLRDFIVGFYSTQDGNAQLVDDAFCAFVWSVVVQQPSVRVGTLPPGLTSEVYIAPQVSAKRKAAAKGEEVAERAPPSLELVEDAPHRSLEDLKREYGNDLRIAVDPETSFAAITGSHIRPPKLSPMVYSALQLITRGREEGITTVDLGRRTQYDQKTCFYLIKQLIELGLIIKARRGGVGNHTCIHKYFVERSPLWQQIQEEEAREDDVVITGENIKPRERADETADQSGTSQIVFDPIDSRHLSSLPLVKNRIVKLLRASRNQIHPSNNLLMAIGFMHPTKTDRRFFQTRLRELIQQGVIERVLVPSLKTRDRMIKCIRLVTPDNELPEGTVVVGTQDMDEDEKDVALGEAATVGHTEVKANLTIHTQVSKLLEEAGSSGLTLNEICASLGNFDKRTIELLLTRASKCQPPAHLGDLGIVDLMETYGRERRHRYFTVAAYKTVMASERLQDTATPFTDVDLSLVGDFGECEANHFYTNVRRLHGWQDSFKEIATAKSKKRKRDGDREGSNGEESELPPKPKRGRPRKTPAPVDDSTTLPKKRGRPRKKPVPPDGDGEDAQTQHKETKKRGRPPKSAKSQPSSTGKVRAKGDEEGAEAPPATGQALVTSETPNNLSLDSEMRSDEAGQTAVAASVGSSSIPDSNQRQPTTATDIGFPEVVHEVESSARRTSHRPGSRDESAKVRPDETPLSRRSKAELRCTPSITSRTPTELSKAVGPGVGPQSHESPLVSTASESIILDTSSARETPGAQDGGNKTAMADLAIGGAGLQGMSATPALQQGVPATPSATSERESIQPVGVAGEKHKSVSASISSRPSKRARTDAGGKSRSNINISSLRRENELYKVIETMGGIANMHSKDIFEAHSALLDTMSQAKEPTSAPSGTRLDKRTAESTLKNLENRGRIKMLKTSLITPSGVSRPACLVYLPETPQEKVNAFLRQLSQSVPSVTTTTVKTLEEPIEYGPSLPSAQRASLPLHLLQIEDQDEKENERLNKLFSYDSNTVRDVLLTERTTVAQLYGFTVGKALRMKQLHIHTLEHFQQPSLSPLVVSREHRIIDISFYQQDITLALYCSIVAIVAHDEDLHRLWSEKGQQTLVKDLPPNLRTSLEVGKSRSRSRILDLLEMLRSLGLVTPLERTELPDAPIKCTNLNGEVIAFRNASLEGWSANTPVFAPHFWRFHTSGPISLWALSESSPSYWKELRTSTTAEAIVYWDELHKVSRDRAYAQAAVCPPTSPPMPPRINPGLGGCLRRRSSWDPEYVLTWHQKQYLAKHIDSSTGKTPVNAEDAEAQTDQICYVVSAPRHVVTNYFTTSGEKLARDLERARQRIKRTRKTEEEERSVEAKETLRKKAEEARAQRERDWDDLLRGVHPEPIKGTLAVRMRSVRNRFMQSTITKDQLHWENEIREAIKETQLASKKIISQLMPKLPHIVHSTAVGPPPLVPNPPEKSVDLLIAQQGPPAHPTSVKRKGKGKVKEETDASRRPRFHWTREFDELARDASAIIRARCRDSKLDLSAFDQVFPAVPRNSVRQRVTHLRENAADDLYMKRLEDQWYLVWLQYRGTPHLPDEDPSSPSNFNLIQHIEFLRRHVDKNALRVGFVEREAPTKLAASVEDLYDRYDIEEDVVSTPAWDFLWSTAVEEAREKQFLRQAFTQEPDDMCEDAKNESVQHAEAALRMVFGTPSELYNSENAARLLHSAGDQSVSVARSNLLHQGVLSKLVRDPKNPKPGRTLKISDINLNAIGGPFPRDLFQDATSLEDVAVERVVDEMEWPLISSEGDVATLLQLVSEDQIDFIIDLSQSQAARPKIDWNSKRADDDDIETSIRLKFSRISVPEQGGNGNQVSESTFAEVDANTLEQETHEGMFDRSAAACALESSSGLINCSACIREAFARFASGLSESDCELAHRIFDRARGSKENGLTKAGCLGLEPGSERRILDLAHKMTLTSPPILFWTYFNTPILVAADYWGAWSVIVSDDPLTFVSPRRWLDLRGHRLDSAWRAALQAVVGIIFLHPGISQPELRWRLRAVYDRQEIIDLLSSLEQDGVLHCRAEAGAESIQKLPGWLKTLDDEDPIFWFISKNYHWYQI